MKNKLKPHYSGSLSEKFWDRVNNLKEPGKRAIYCCGVLLQNLETSVLLWLDNAENRDNHKRR
jgi:hypothetical protein